MGDSLINLFFSPRVWVTVLLTCSHPPGYGCLTNLLFSPQGMGGSLTNLIVSPQGMGGSLTNLFFSPQGMGDSLIINLFISPQGMGDSLQGFANFLLFCLFTENIRNRFRLACARVMPCCEPDELQPLTLEGTENAYDPYGSVEVHRQSWD